MKVTTTVLSLMMVLFFTVIAGQSSVQAEGKEEIEKVAKQLIGVPYASGGSSPRGFDCSGFTTYVFKNSLGITLPRSSAAQYDGGTKVNRAKMEMGDLVFFATDSSRPKSVSHVGIYLGDGSFIHADSTRGIKINSIEDNGYWEKRFIGAVSYTN